MLDLKKKFDIKILSGGERLCSVSYPTNEMWCERVRKIKAVRRSLGRDKAQFDPSNQHQVDAELFAKIRQDKDGAEFDQAEASKVIERLERCEVLGIERDGNFYRVSMQVVNKHRVTHVLRIPREADVLEYQRSQPRPTHGARTTEFRIALEPAITLWGKCEAKTEGYTDGMQVPAVHMEPAITAVLSQVEIDSEEPDPED